MTATSSLARSGQRIWNWDSFRVVFREDYWYLEHFWHQLGNSFYMASATMVLTVLIGFAGQLRVGAHALATRLAGQQHRAADLYPAGIIPADPVRASDAIYGLTDSLWAVIAAEVTFATPYAILVLQRYGRLIPLELDEAASVDGATPVQMYFRIYLPLMAPALAAVGIYALLLAWNEYLYQYPADQLARNATVAVGDEPVLR